MSDLTCAEVHELSGEFALGILAHSQRARVAAHLLRCPDCRREIAPTMAIGVRLLELIPGTEPPLGFDVRCWPESTPAAGRSSRRSRPLPRRLLLPRSRHRAACAASPLGRRTTPPRFVKEVTPLGWCTEAAGRLWGTMTLRGDTASGPVICEMYGAKGRVTPVGDVRPLAHDAERIVG